MWEIFRGKGESYLQLINDSGKKSKSKYIYIYIPHTHTYIHTEKNKGNVFKILTFKEYGWRMYKNSLYYFWKFKPEIVKIYS